MCSRTLTQVDTHTRVNRAKPPCAAEGPRGAPGCSLLPEQTAPASQPRRARPRDPGTQRGVMGLFALMTGADRSLPPVPALSDGWC